VLRFITTITRDVWRLGWATTVLFIIATVGQLKVLSQGTTASFHTTVVPTSGENVAKPCEYDLRILNGNKRIRALFVVFERGPELQHFYEEPEVAAFAREHDLAMLMPMGCPATDHGGDIDVDPNHGLGRSLLTAVDQLSVTTNHPELRTAPLLLMGFSGAGALVGRLVGFAPDRIATAIVSHGGQVPPLNLDTITLSDAALKTPLLILVGGKDKTVGTEKAYSYFSKYWQRGAPWLFAIQNDAGHFCNEDATELILSWVKNILENLSRRNVSGPVDRTTGSYAYFSKRPTGELDSGKLPLMEAIDLRIETSSTEPPRGEVSAGWLPSKEVVFNWERFTNLPDHHTATKP
jgi:predicted esterase